MLSCYMYPLSGSNLPGIWAHKIRLSIRNESVWCSRLITTRTLGFVVLRLYAIGSGLLFEIVNDLEMGLVSGP